MANVPFDASIPSPERQEALERLYHEGVIKDPAAPYRGVQIRTLGELQWIMAQRQWSGDQEVPDGTQRANLRAADLSEADLYQANLRGANLYRTNLNGTKLSAANLSGANLARALMNPETVLDGMILDTHTKVAGVRWNGTSLDRIHWETVPHLGDEPSSEDVSKLASRQEHAQAYRNAAQAYHGLVVALRDQGLAEPASQFRLREQIMLRKASLANHNWGNWLLNAVLGLVAGYGEKPNRAFGTYLGIVTLFAAIFWASTNFLHTGTPHLLWYEAAVLSLSSFHGRGFFTNTIQLGDPLAIIAAFEAVSGLFIELIFIATFSKRFLD